MAVIPDTLLHYRILRPLGSGGMGDVYLAEDTKLGRRVALKVLAGLHAAAAPERRQRFDREARIVAALNHPNVVTIHAVEHAGDQTFIVMEWIEGQTLSSLIRAHGLPVGQILKLATPVAEAMAASHDRGITHRDLKPGNIMVTTDGRVKVLDFGLAKLTDATRLDDDTRTQASADLLTGEGRFVGTVSYMSPEQVEGKPADSRSDIFALGIVLYEMATGSRPFTGDSTVAVFSAILKDAPRPISEINPSLPRDLARIIKRALAKDPDHRYQTAKDLRNDLEALKEELESGALDTPAVPLVQPAPRGRRGLVVAAAVLSAGLAGFGGWHYATRSSWWAGPAPAARPFERVTLSRVTNTGNVSRSALSADGQYIVHAVTEAGKQSLWLRHVATTSNVQIVEPALRRISHIGFTPDSHFIYYAVYPEGQSFSNVFQVPVLGGPPRRIIDDVDSGLAFSPDGLKFAFVRGNNARGEDAIIVANADGSGERPLVVGKRPLSFSPGAVAWSPDGSVLLAIRRVDNAQRFTAVAIDVKTAHETLIGRAWANINSLAWRPDRQGVIVTAREAVSGPSQIWHLSYPGGEAHRITSDLNDYGQLSLSADGRTLVATQTENLARLWVWRLDDPSRATQISTGPNPTDGARGLSWTTDRRIAYSATANNGTRDIWIVDEAGRYPRPLTVDPADDVGPVVTPDGRSILYNSDREGGSIWRMDLDGSNQRPLVTTPGAAWPVVSHDQRWLFYTLTAESRRSVWRMPFEGGPAERLTARWDALGVTDDGVFFHPTMVLAGVTADGTQGLGLYSDPERRGFRFGLFPFAGGSPMRFDIPTHAVITADGRDLIYPDERGGTPRLLRQPIAGGPAAVLATLPAGVPLATVSPGRRIALSPDGKSLAMSLRSVTSDVVRITAER